MIVKEYPIARNPLATLVLPEGSEILSLKVRDHQPVIYVMVDPTKTKKVSRIFLTVHTREELPKYHKHYKYIDTLVVHGSVKHVFEKIR